jgi:serine/threonine protein kinase/PAS domain-containing protein
MHQHGRSKRQHRARMSQLAGNQSVGTVASHTPNGMRNLQSSSLHHQSPSYVSFPEHQEEADNPSARNPLRDPPYGVPHETPVLVDALAPGTDDIPALLRLRRYAVLGTREAEQLLCTCMQEVPQVILALFQDIDPTQAVDPKKDAMDKIRREAVTGLLSILADLPASSFVGLDGMPDGSFFSMVTGLCKLWQADTPQYTSSQRLASLRPPAEAVAQVALRCRVRLPLQDRVVRIPLTSYSSSKLLQNTFFVAEFFNVMALTAGAAALIVPQLMSPTASSVIVVVATAVAAVLAAWPFYIQSVNRTAGDALRNCVQTCVATGLAKVSLAGTARPIALADLGRRASASPNVARRSWRASQRDGRSPNRVSDEGGTTDDGAATSTSRVLASRIALPSNFRNRYPAGAVLLPLENVASPQTSDAPSSPNTGVHWACFDARPVNRHAMVIGLDMHRNVTVWNSAAQELTGTASRDAVGCHATMVLSMPDDQLQRLPRLIGNSCVLTLKTLAFGDIRVEATVDDMRDAAGNLIGYCMVSQAEHVNNGVMKAYLHEYFQLELWSALEVVTKIDSQLDTLIKTLPGTLAGERNHPTPPPSVAPTPTSRASQQSTGIGYDRTSNGMPVLENENGGECRENNRRGSDTSTVLGRRIAPGAAQDLSRLSVQLHREVHRIRMDTRRLSWGDITTMARQVTSAWVWTNGETFLGTAVRDVTAAVAVEPDVPASFRLPENADRLARCVVEGIPVRCAIALRFSQRSGRVSRLSVVVTLGAASGGTSFLSDIDGRLPNPVLTRNRLRSRSHDPQWRFDPDGIFCNLSDDLRDLRDSCVTCELLASDTVLCLHFPCIRESEAGRSVTSSPRMPDRQPAPPQAKCHVSVAVCLRDPDHQGTLCNWLLSIAGVSVVSCHGVDELKHWMSSADVVIVANSYRDLIDAAADELVQVVIPVVDESMPFDDDDGALCLRLPLDRKRVFELLVAASEVVEQDRIARDREWERDELLNARHDASWTQGELLGRGTSGVCYIATDQLTGGRMAVKELQLRLTDAATIDRFMESLTNEIRILKQLDHPNIVRYLRCESTDRGVNLFMELCDCSLHKVIKSRRSIGDLYLRAIPTILHQILLAVAHLHGLAIPIVHRDLKPHNILLKGNEIKLTDFGTAHQLAQGETMQDVRGTLRFMSPEVYAGKTSDRSCDVWSIGCVLCELLGVKVPFRQKLRLHDIAEIQQKDIVLSNVDNISPDARDFISLCLRVDKEERPTVSNLLLHPYLQRIDHTVRLSSITQSVVKADQCVAPVGVSETENGVLAAASPKINPTDMPQQQQAHVPRGEGFDDDDDGIGFTLKSNG